MRVGFRGLVFLVKGGRFPASFFYSCLSSGLSLYAFSVFPCANLLSILMCIYIYIYIYFFFEQKQTDFDIYSYLPIKQRREGKRNSLSDLPFKMVLDSKIPCHHYWGH